MEVDYLLDDKFGGEMEFGSCLTNSAPKFINITDIDGTILRVGYKDYNQPLSHLRRYFLDSSKSSHAMKGKEIVFKFVDKHSSFCYYPFEKFTIKALLDDINKSIALNNRPGKIVAYSVSQVELPYINNYVEIELVEIETSIIEIGIAYSDTILDVKQKVEQLTKYKRVSIDNQEEYEWNISVESMRLFYEEIQLENDVLLSNFDIKARLRFRLSVQLWRVPRMQVFVTALKGATITFEVYHTDLVESLMNKIYVREGIPPEQQRIVYGGIQLEVGKRLMDYNIHETSGLSLLMRLMGGCFSPSTLIMLSKGVWEPISSLKVGMKITSSNEGTKQFEEDKVTKVVTNEVRCKITIFLENGERIQCTPNHLFLTVDGKWKRHEYRDGQVRLRVGDELVSADGQPQKIMQIEYKDIVAEKFFHICVKDNHNFVVGGGVIAHNMQILIKYQNKQKIGLDADTSIQILKLKQMVSNVTKISIKNIQLLYAGRVLSDDTKRLSDYENDFGSGQPELQLRIINHEQIFGKESFEVSVHCQAHNMVKVKVSPGDKISKLQEWVQMQKDISLRNQLARCNQKILDGNKTFSFYKIHKFSLITVDLLDISVTVNLEKERIQVRFNKKLEIRVLLDVVSYIKNINRYRLKLFQEGKEVNLRSNLNRLGQESYEFECKMYSEEYAKKYEQLSTAKTKIKIDMVETVELNYLDIRDGTVAQVLRMAMNNPESYYCLMFGKLILKPSDQIKAIETSLNYVSDQDFMLIVLKNSEKLEFYRNISSETPFPLEHFKIDKKIENMRRISRERIESAATASKFKREVFYTPIHYYTCNRFYGAINAFLRNIKYESPGVFESNEVRFIANLIKSLNELPNYLGIVHRGINNFRFSNYQAVGDCFYWKSFTSTSIRPEVAEQFKKSGGTVFHITSLTGKDLSLFSIYEQEKEVLFYPFTYFLVDQIDRKENFDEVWLTEMPSPVTFVKNLLIWVDDVPKNNQDMVKLLYERGVEVIQLTSTKMADKWTQEFNWLLNWMDVKFKVVSDMVRVEGGVNNYYAGIDLLERFYNIKGYSTPILIFCSDTTKGMENAAQRKIKGGNIYKITNHYKDFEQYVTFK